MSKFWLLLGPALVLISALATTPLVRNRLDRAVSSSHFSAFSKLATVTFVPTHDFLNIIIFTARNPNLDDTSDFVFTLSDAQNKILRQILFSGRNIGDPGDIRLQFEPVGGIIHQPLTARIISTTATSSWVQFAVDDHDQLSFRSYYRGAGFLSAWQTNFFLLDPVFFIIWAMFLVSLVLLSEPFHILGDRKFS